MKKLIYMFIIMMSVFIGIDGVKADNEEKECRFLSEDGTTSATINYKGDVAYPVINYFRNKTVDATIIPIYTDYIKEDEKNKCSNYAVVLANSSSGFGVDYFITLFSDANEAKEYAKKNEEDFMLKTKAEFVKLKNEQKNPDDPVGENDDSEKSEYKYGCKIFGDTIVEIIKEIYGYFKWIIPVLVIILSMLDFIKVVTSGKDDDFKKAQNNLIKRIILAIVFFIVPGLISFMIKFSGITAQFTNGDSIIEAVTCIFE